VTAAPPVLAPPATASSKRSSVEVALTTMLHEAQEPEAGPARTDAESRMDASTSLLRIATITVTPTAAEPVVSASAPPTLTIFVVSSALTSTLCVDAFVVWFTRAPSPIQAFVSNSMRSTMNEPVTAAVPPPALPPTATEVTAGRLESSFSCRPVTGTIGSSVVLALTLVAPVALVVVTCPTPVPESM
jgi:hypothetical protein